MEILGAAETERILKYLHFVSRVADFKGIWNLQGSDGLVTMGDEAGHNCIPVWPHKRYAESYIRDEWSEAKATMIELDAT